MRSSSPDWARLRAHDLLRLAAVALAYFLTARIGLGVHAVHGVAAAVWPASGLAVAALILWGRRMWPAIAVAVFAANASVNVPVLACLAIMVGNTLEAVLAEMALRRFASKNLRDWGSAGDVLVLVTLVSGASAVVGASVGTAATYLAGTVPREALTLALRTWWTGDALGILLVTPLVLSVPSLVREPWPRARVLEAIGTLLVLCLVAVLAFGSTVTVKEGPRAYMVFPAVLWTAVRFRQPGASIAVALVALLAVAATLSGVGPFALGERHDSLLALQVFLALASATALTFGAMSAERHEASTALAREHAFTRAVLDTAGLLVVLDPKGTIARCNRACERLVGRDLTGGEAFASALATPDQRAEIDAALEKIVRTRQPSTFESRCATGAGERAIVWTATPLLDAHGVVEHVIASGNDLTNSRRLEAQLVAADRLSAMGTLAAGVGHEINNPLAYTMMSLELAKKLVRRGQDRMQERADLDQLLDTALEGSERVRRIVADLKSLARVSDDAPGPVDVHRVLEACIPMASNEIRHRARLVKDYHTVPMVDADESRLGQVFLNLLINAAQAVPEGHVMRNEVRVHTGVDPEGRVVVEVSDTGVGIDPQHVSRLFEPFFTTKPMGVGLGLSVCHAIVTSFGGTLSVESERGRGTSFRVTLPASATTSALANPPREEAAAGEARKLRILIVDDERAVSRSLAAFLSDHEVELAGSGRQALELCRIKDYDLVLCDLLMPELTGMDVYEELVQTRPGYEQRFVFMTGGAFTQRAADFLARVPNPRLDKPFATEDLLSLVAERARQAVAPIAEIVAMSPGEGARPRRRSAGV